MICVVFLHVLSAFVQVLLPTVGFVMLIHHSSSPVCVQREVNSSGIIFFYYKALDGHLNLNPKSVSNVFPVSRHMSRRNPFDTCFEKGRTLLMSTSVNEMFGAVFGGLR